jgi:hypothetical protein
VLRHAADSTVTGLHPWNKTPKVVSIATSCELLRCEEASSGAAEQHMGENSRHLDWVDVKLLHGNRHCAEVL